MTSEISNLILQKPIFILQDNKQRQYLPKITDNSLFLYINDDPSIQIWKQQLTVLQYASLAEKNVLLHSNKVQTLTEQRLIDIIQNNHLQLSLSSMTIPVDKNLLEEIWKDLFYLQPRINKLNISKPLLVPIQESSHVTLIQNTTLPTIFGLDIRPYINSTAVTFVHFPYYNVDPNPLINHLQWEYFLLKMNCKPPSIKLPHNYTITRLPILPLFTMFTDEKLAILGEFILSTQPKNTQEVLRQFPILAQVNSEEQLQPISTTFDESIITDLPLLPRINIPSYCHSLAVKMGVCAEYDSITCVTILQYLGEEKITNVDLYIEWLGRLQLELRQKNKIIDNKSFRSICQLYLPDQQQFCSLKNLLIMSEINDKYRQGILLVCKYLKLQLISSTTNQTYWQFKDLFRTLGCQCTVTIENIYQTIQFASNDKHNFYSLGDHLTILKENGMETMITLFQYLEDSIVKCVADSAPDTNLYHAIITQKHPKAFYGSREDLQWRFALTSKEISSELKKLIGIPVENASFPLLTIDRQLITEKFTTIMYACFETKIIQNLSRTIGKRHFISPVITRTCPLILALFGIDYVERRGKIKWTHQNINLEHHLTHLTQIFQETTGDRELEVVNARYANVHLLISDEFVIETNDDVDIDNYQMESDYPFWIFNKTVLLCTGDAQDNSSRAIIATSALASLIHKRQHVPFDEAKLIARQNIADCTEFASKLPSHFASTKPDVYSYLDVIFPTDHELIESMIISIGPNCRIEQDPEEIFIAPERSGEDKIYRNRAEQQNHRDQTKRTPNNWMNPAIVDGEEHIRIGQNAEHFFFTYLQKLYGNSDITPTNNWRSSARSKIYPQYTRNMDDSLGYDMELHDKHEHFVKGTKSTTKKCFFEVKGTSGSFHEEKTSFHISQNEREKCQSIACDSRKQEREAYLLVIIEYCLDPEKIALAKLINWSSHFYSVELKVDSYQCRFYSKPSVDTTTQDNSEDSNIDADNSRHEEFEHPNRFNSNNHNRDYRQTTNYDNRHSRNFPNNPHHHLGQEHWQSMSSNNEPSHNQRDYPYPSRNQQQQRHEHQYQQEHIQQFHGRGRGRGRGLANRPNAQDSNWRRR